MKSKYKNRILLVGITVGSVFFHHEPGKKPCAEFYFQPFKKKYCEKERMILRCKAYDEAAYTVKNSYHGYFYLVCQKVTSDLDPYDAWETQDYLLVVHAFSGCSALESRIFNHASCSGDVIYFSEGPGDKQEFMLFGFDSCGDSHSFYCRMARPLTQEEKMLLHEKVAVTVIGEIRPHQEADDNFSVTDMMDAGKHLILSVRRIIPLKRR